MNKNITQLLQQLAGIWKQLGVNQRISITITTLAVLAGLAGVAIWSSRTEYSLLYGKLSQEDASKVIASLDEQKVLYEIGRGGDSIMVPADKVYQTRMQMAGKGIPRGSGVGYEIFDKPTFGISDLVQQANLTRAIQGELERTISQLDEVESARVMIVKPDNQLLSDPNRKPTASVFVVTKGNSELPSSAVNSIRFLVANSVEGLQINNISVVDNKGTVLSANEENDSIAGQSNHQLTARRDAEQYLSKKAESMLNTVLGPGQAVVRVSAELNWDTTSRSDEQIIPDSGVPTTTTENTEETTSDTATAGGSPGVGSNANPGDNGTNTVAAVPMNHSTTTKKVVSNNFQVSKTTSNTVIAAGGIKHLSAAVFIAQQLDGTNADAKPKARTPEEITQLKQIVQSAIGLQDTTLITLAEMPFNQQVAPAMIQQMNKDHSLQTWLSLAEKMIYPALAAGVIFAFWRMFQKAKTEEVRLGALGNGNGRGQFGGSVIPGKGLVTVEVLNQLIRENPANMTQAVRGWLGRSKN